MVLDNLPFSIDNELHIEKVCEYIKNVKKHVSVLNISGNLLSLESIKMLSFNGINRNNSLIKLVVSNTALNKGSIEFLLDNILRWNQSLIDIDLSNNPAQKHLENKIGSNSGSAAIAHFMAKSRYLQFINLKGINLSGEGIKQVLFSILFERGLLI